MKGEGTTQESAQSRNFTPAQVAALRAELVKQVRRTTYDEVAKTLGIHTQQVWKIVAGKKSCSYFTASRIAQLAGYRGVDAFFEAKGIALPRIVPLPPKRKPKPPPKTDASEFAVRLRAVLGRVRDNFGGRAAVTTVARELGLPQARLKEILRGRPGAIDIGTVVAVRAYLLAQDKARLVDEILGVVPAPSGPARR